MNSAIASPNKNQPIARYVKHFAIAAMLCATFAVSADIVCYMVLGETSAGTWYDKYWMGFFFCCAFIASSFVILRDKLGDKPEYLYLVIVLTVSIFMAWSLSVFMLAWDTGIHFKHVLGWADLDDEFELSQSELAFVTTSLSGTTGIDIPRNLEGLYHLEAWLNANDGEPVEVRTAYSFWKVLTHINYIPCAIVMFFCELTDLPFSTKYFLALLPSPIIYSLVTFLGMKKLRSGKMLYAAIALLPTMMFLTANYGYQYWNMAFFMYGFACLASFMQRKEVVPVREVIVMLAALVLGALPRLSYAPLILLALLTPRCCFATRKRSVAFRATIIAATILAASIFAIPILLNGLGEGDSRVHTSVNPTAQLDYITSEPNEFAGILANYLFAPFSTSSSGEMISGYLTPRGSFGFIGHYAYLGFMPSPLIIISIVLLIATTLTDKNSTAIYGMAAGTVCLIMSLGTAIAITIYMYITFNNVESEVISGVQSRYLLPLIYPSLAFLGSHKWGLNGSAIPSSAYNGTVLGVMSFVLLLGWWSTYLVNIY